MQIKFSIPYPNTPEQRKAWNKAYSLNAIYSGKHWAQRQKDAELWHWLTVSALRKAKLLGQRPLDKPVIITFFWNDGLDCSNHAYMAKMIEDALRHIVIRNDSRKWVRGMEHYFHDKPCIGVVVTEVDKP